MGCECSRESTYEDFESPDDTVIGQEKFNRWKERLILAPLHPGGDAVIGSGASCKIYRVQDRKFDDGPPQQIGFRNTTWTRPRPEFLALKVMDGTHSHIRRLWYNEVCNLRHLAPLTSSRHLVEFVDAYRYSNYYYILTAFYPGGDLFTAVENMGTQQANELDAAKLLRDMFRALFACHNQGVTHRDVKPENFVFDVKGHETSLRLIDFGCSKFGPDDMVLKDKPQSVYYVAPEVLAPDTSTESRYCWRRCTTCSEIYLCPPQPEPTEVEVGPNDPFDDDDVDEEDHLKQTDGASDSNGTSGVMQPQVRKKKVHQPEVGSGVCIGGAHTPDPNGRYRLRRPAGYNPQPDGSAGIAPSPDSVYQFKLTSGVAVFAPCSACGSLVCADRNIPGQAYCRATRSLHVLPLTTQQKDANDAQSAAAAASMGLVGLVSPTIAPNDQGADSGPTPFALPVQSGNSTPMSQAPQQAPSSGSNSLANPRLSDLSAQSSYGLLTRGLKPGVRKVLREGGWKVCACCAVVYRAPHVPLNTARNPSLLQKDAHPARHTSHDETDYDETNDPARQELRERRAEDAVAVVTDREKNQNLLGGSRLESVSTMLPDSESTRGDSSSMLGRDRGYSRSSEASTTVMGFNDNDNEMSASATPIGTSGATSRTTSQGSQHRSSNSRTRSIRVSRSSSRNSRSTSDASSTPTSSRNHQQHYASSAANPFELPFDLRVEFDPSLNKELEVITCPFALARTLPRLPRTRAPTGCFSNRDTCGFLFGDDDEAEKPSSSNNRIRSSSVASSTDRNGLNKEQLGDIRIDVPESIENEDTSRERIAKVLNRVLHRPYTYPLDEDTKQSPENDGESEKEPINPDQPIFLDDPVETLDEEVYEEVMRTWGRHTPLDLDGFGEVYEDEAEDILLQLQAFSETVEGDGRGHVSPMAGAVGSLSPRRRFEAARALNVELDGDGKPLFALTQHGNPSRRGTEFFIEVSRTMNIGVWKASDMWSMGVVMYVLLTGCAPFYSQDFHKIPGIISACDWTMPQDLSLAAKDLLSRLLQRDPLSRPTAWQVLHHPWLHTAFHKSARPLKHIAAALDDLRYHDDSSHLRRIFARAIITQQLHDESRFDEVRNVLSAFDHDGDGELSVDDVASLVAVLEDRKKRARVKAEKHRKLHVSADTQNLDETPNTSNSPSFNSISDDGFLLPIESAGFGTLSEEIVPKSEGGSSPLDSIQGVKPELSLRHVDFATQAMQNIILTRENKLSYTELKVIIAAATLGTPSSFLGDIPTVFKLLDTKQDGYLDHEELTAACSSFLSRDEVSDLLVVVDENGDGKINLSEFTRALSRQSHVRRGGSPVPGSQNQSHSDNHDDRDDDHEGGVDDGESQGEGEGSDGEMEGKFSEYQDSQDVEDSSYGQDHEEQRQQHEQQQYDVENSDEQGVTNIRVDMTSDAMTTSATNSPNEYAQGTSDEDHDTQSDNREDDSMIDTRTPVGVGGAQSHSTEL